MTKKQTTKKPAGWVPQQHGAWAMIVVPFLAGLVLAARVRPLDLGDRRYLLSPQDLLQGLELLEQAGQGYAFPVTPFPSPIQRALRRHEDGRTEPFDARHVGSRTQDLEPAYHDAGQFYWGATPSWIGGLNIHQNARTFVIPEWRCVDIDTPDDWLRAEALYGVLRAKDHP